MLANAHSFKDKKDKLSDVNAGLFTYPVLMAADILLYSANFVPVGKDQIQHLEITRDIATGFNNQYGDIFTIPEVKVDETVMTVPGVDGQKMSKSYNNTIDIFQADKPLYKSIKKIISDSTPLEDPKDPTNDVTFQLYSLISTLEEKEGLAQKYRGGNFGYGHAKKEFYELILDRFQDQRTRYQELIADPNLLEDILKKGEESARKVALPLLEKVRTAVGF
jgi:tryptophanyl-tRNA synthetase